MEAGRTCIALDDKFLIKRMVKNKQKTHINLKETVPPTIKKQFHYVGFCVLMLYPRNILQVLTQVPCLVVSNFREQLFGFPVTVLKNPHHLSGMDEGLLLTN